jgi:PAS domain-containing protein
MRNLFEVVKKVGFAVDIGYWMVDLGKGVAYFPKGLGRPHVETEPGLEAGYQVLTMDRTLAAADPADRDRFRLWIDGFARPGDETRVIELAWHSSWGDTLQLRLAGRRVDEGEEARIVGLVEVLTRWKEAERLARSLSFIIEAMFISMDDGVVIFDSHLRVRRLNRNALDLFGLGEDDEARGDWAAQIEAMLPRSTREQLLEAIAHSSAVSGILAPNGFAGPRLSWRANPWGSSDADMSGIVMVVASKRPTRSAVHAESAALRGEGIAPPHPHHHPDPKAESPPRHRTSTESDPPHPAAAVGEATNPETSRRHDHRALEWVKHPVLLVSIASGEIVYANRIAREVFHLPSDRRSFAQNVYDVSGFPSDPDPLSTVGAGHHLVHLKMGARVGRMFDYDDDLLFVEYHDELPHPRNPAVVAHHAAR